MSVPILLVTITHLDMS